MFELNNKSIVGQQFHKTADPNVVFTCIGYGQHPTTGAMFFAGTSWDQQNNRSKVDTFLLKDVTFVGKLPDPVI